MASNPDIFLGELGSEIKVPYAGRNFSVKPIEALREKRTVDGTLKVDIKYVKNIFNLTYKTITGPDLNTLLTIYRTITQPLSLIISTGTDGDGAQETYLVYMKTTPRTRYTLRANLWTGVKFILSEA